MTMRFDAAAGVRLHIGVIDFEVADHTREVIESGMPSLNPLSV